MIKFDKCGDNYNSRDCKLDMSKDRVGIRCANCGENHPAFSKKCVRYKNALEVRKVQVSKKISYSDAVKEVAKERDRVMLVNNVHSRSPGVVPDSVSGRPGTSAMQFDGRSGRMLELNNRRSVEVSRSRPMVKEVCTQTESETVSTQTDSCCGDCKGEGSIGLKVVNDLSSDDGNIRMFLADCLLPALELIPKELIANCIFEILCSCLATNGKLVKNSKKLIETCILKCQAKIGTFILEAEKKKRKYRSSDSVNDVNENVMGKSVSSGAGRKAKKVNG